MADILNQIIFRKKQDLAWAKKSATKRLNQRKSPPKSLATALQAKQLAIIAEIKRASPSKGVIAKDYDLAAIAKSYSLNGAAAISVLTEQHYFQGALDHLTTVHHTVDLPVLRKDFILDAWQLEESFLIGADAVLLIVAALKKSELALLLKVAAEFKLSVLVEVHSHKELALALDCGAEIIGVNNRNLNNFKVDLNLSYELIAAIPQQLVAVSESGIDQASQLQALAKAGFDAALIGTSFMSHADPGKALGNLIAAG